MKLGTFTREDAHFTGAINSLTLKAKATIQPIDKAHDNAPDYRIYAAGGVELGAAWAKVSKGERPYLAVTLDDPSFPQPIYARLVELAEGTYRLIWSR
jgi:uncharacterized protein (DUF736 family)